MIISGPPFFKAEAEYFPAGVQRRCSILLLWTVRPPRIRQRRTHNGKTEKDRKMTPLGLDHVAYRCKDAQETTDFYTKLLDMKLVAAVSHSHVPSTKAYCPHIHVFFGMADGSCVAFFETPEEPEMTLDPNTPDWVQHLALELPDEETLLAMKARLEAAGISVVGPKDGHMCVSIYFFDPSGHRLELTYRKIDPDARTERDAYRILEVWNETKQPVTGIELEHDI